ncbi:S8 family serine peptidase [Virgibacillus dokdonensis]|uniref:Peptidase S8/S53 domain-containing protein n=1 Tax=Virgibacillus dokdonensis TaxID=302167 RepID=A0A2K9IZS2_9BACI|nr:S8 family serine peptidase [Virgibacillus dokdonensis]AUJ25207.1 hypothetical protein A21D_02143 [Virgibacillus dokdonensis]
MGSTLFYSLTIGSITRDEHEESISRKKEISPFSRIGYGFSGCKKPDLVYPGGNIYRKKGSLYIAANSAAYVINNKGYLEQEFGTSFSAPLAAADLAVLTNNVQDNDPLIARALLTHHANNNHYFNNSEDTFFKKVYGYGEGDFESANSSSRNKATYIRKGAMNRLSKQRVRFYMPTVFLDHRKKGKNLVKVSVTCISIPPIDKGMGNEYIRGYVDASLHAINTKGKQTTKNPPNKLGRNKWSHIQHFNKILSAFNPGDWQIWLQLYTKPEIDSDIDYVLIVSIEDITGNNLDVYGSISIETDNRFSALAEIELNEMEE